ncbi:MAG: acyl-CoA dehydrogenase family protein [Thiolinea sp.]
MNTYQTPWMDEELTLFRDSIAKFYAAEMAPHEPRWQKQGHVDRDFWLKAGEMGLLCASVPEEYGGMGGDFRHEAVIVTGAVSCLWCVRVWQCAFTDLRRLYPGIRYGSAETALVAGMANGELVSAIAMTEPGTGSDLQAIKTTAKADGDGYVINGSKTFITNGQQADLIILVTKTNRNWFPRYLAVCPGNQRP